MALAVAILVGAIAGGLSLQPDRYRFHWAWVGRATAGVVILLFLAFHGFAGAIGWWLARGVGVVNLEPSKSAIADGVTYAVLGQALVRAQFTRFPVSDPRGGFSLLGQISDWLLSWLWSSTSQNIGTRVRSFTDSQLAQYSLDLVHRHAEDDEALTDSLRERMLEGVRLRSREIQGGTADGDATDARAALRAASERLTRQYMVLPPSQ